MSSYEMISVQELRFGDRVMAIGSLQLVTSVEWINERMFYKKIARAMRMAFIGGDSVDAHPGQPVRLY